MPKKKVELADILEAVKGLGERIEKLETKDVFTLKTEPTETKTTTITPTVPEYLVPAEYRTAVDEILSPRFGIKIEPDSDRPAFTLKILVPKEYSNASEGEWKSTGGDVRAKVLTYGEGILGVRTYLELIKKNLGPEINAKIQLDK